MAGLMSAGPNGPCPPPGEPGVTLRKGGHHALQHEEQNE